MLCHHLLLFSASLVLPRRAALTYGVHTKSSSMMSSASSASMSNHSLLFSASLVVLPSRVSLTYCVHALWRLMILSASSINAVPFHRLLLFNTSLVVWPSKLKLSGHTSLLRLFTMNVGVSGKFWSCIGIHRMW